MKARSTLITKDPDSYHHGDLRQALTKAAFMEVERAGAETINLAALAKALGVSQPAPYRHFADRDALLEAVAAEGFRAFSTILRKSISRPSKRSALSRIAQAYVAFGLEHKEIYRLMFGSQLAPKSAQDSELRAAALDSFGLLLKALAPSVKPEVRELSALKIWAALHGAVMLTEQGLLSGAVPGVSLKGLVEEIVA